MARNPRGLILSPNGPNLGQFLALFGFCWVGPAVTVTPCPLVTLPVSVLLKHQRGPLGEHLGEPLGEPLGEHLGEPLGEPLGNLWGKIWGGLWGILWGNLWAKVISCL